MLGDSAQITQHALDRVAIGTSKCVVYFAPLKNEALFQDWQEPVCTLTVCDNRLGVINSVKNLRSLITTGDVW